MRKNFSFVAILLLFGLFSFGSSCWADVASNQAVFNEVKELVASRYIYMDYKNVNWDALCNQYENQIVNSRNDNELFENIAVLLENIKDGHLKIIDPINNKMRGWLPEYKVNWNLNAIARIVENYKVINKYISIGNVENIGYIMINSWSINDEKDFDILKTILHNDFKDTDGLIIDVRMNEGGYAGYAVTFPREFTDGSSGEKLPIGYIDIVKGPYDIEYDIPQSLIGIGFHPEEFGMPFYSKPVVVLTGNASASAAEYFIQAMISIYTVTTMGDTTRGCIGGPFRYPLNNNRWELQITEVAYKDINKRHIEDVGIVPDIYVAFIADGSDNVLIRAFEELGVEIVNDDGSGGGDSGGGGCNTGFGIVLFLIFATPLISRKK